MLAYRPGRLQSRLTTLYTAANPKQSYHPGGPQSRLTTLYTAVDPGQYVLTQWHAPGRVGGKSHSSSTAAANVQVQGS